MKTRRFSTACVAAALTALVAYHGAGNARAQQPAEPEGGEVLTRGPVHEAFVETVTFDPEAGIVVPRMPPEAIEELPPEQRPEGENVAWIPGYWAWDDERSDFLWVSGIWRSLPPGRQWVPGYWAEAAEGAQWTAGYWADSAADEIQYLPEPPATVEAGPNVEATSDNQSWIPGCWIWHESRYAWRPGYWETAQPNWVWVPAYYVWTPGGYVFVDGYWDYSVDRRGLVFAPVFFDQNVYSRQGFSYSPTTVINPAVFGSHLFCRPNYQHYYFGDYYAANYAHAGFHPWFSFHNHHGYDPLYAQQSWRHRKDRDWDHNLQADFQHRRDHEDNRPPRTWADQRASGEKGLIMAASLSQLAKSKDSPLRLETLDKPARQKLAQHGRAVDEFRQERQQREAQGAAAAKADPSERSERAIVKFGKSPLAANAAQQPGKDFTPPKRHEDRQPDTKIEPRKRTAGSEPGLRDPLPEPRAEPKKPMPRTEPGKPEPRAEPKKPMPRTEPGKPEPRAEPKKPMPRTEPGKPEPRAEPKKPMPRTEPGKPEPRTEPKKPMPRTEPGKPEPRTEPKKPMPRTEPNKPEPRTEPKPMPRAEPKRPMPRTEPNKPEPRAEPARPAPRAEPARPAPRAEPARPAPRAEPARPAPRAEPARPATRAEPKPMPRAEPKAAPPPGAAPKGNPGK